MSTYSNSDRMIGPNGWEAMDTAPRDGTIVELVCTYGIMPWYGLFRWENSRWTSPEGGRSVSTEKHLRWRPTTQQPSEYIDPTGGAQNTREYWLR